MAPTNQKTRVVIDRHHVLARQELHDLARRMFDRHQVTMSTTCFNDCVRAAHRDVCRTELRGIVGFDAFVLAVADLVHDQLVETLTRPPHRSTIEYQCREVAAQYWRDRS